MFDAYHKWLGIPLGTRPPTHYQLLGIAPEETDAEVIEEAAIRQSAHVRTYQIGPRAPECARILAEIALARATLLNPIKRREYDTALAKTRQPKASPDPGKTVAGQPSAQSPKATPFADLKPKSSSDSRKKRSRRVPATFEEESFSRRRVVIVIVSSGLALVLVAALIIGLVLTDQRGHESSAENGKPDGAAKKKAPGTSVQVEEWVDAPINLAAKRPFAPGAYARSFTDPDGKSELLRSDETRGSFALALQGTEFAIHGKGMKGPRILLEAGGNFVAAVRVRATATPPTESAFPGTLARREAALFIWRDENNYVRIDRTCWPDKDGSPVVTMNFLFFREGRPARGLLQAAKDLDTTMYIVRQGKSIKASWKQAGARRSFPEEQEDWPDKLYFGVGARNNSKQPCEVEFEDLQLSGFVKRGKILMHEEGSLDEKSPSDSPHRSGTPYTLFTAKLKAGNLYIIEMHRTNADATLDPYLILLDPRGDKIASDDDSAGNRNARIVFQAKETGAYQILATTLFRNNRGPFQLIFSEAK